MVRGMISERWVRYPAVATALAIAGAATTLLVDAAIPSHAWPAWLSFPGEGARTLLGGIAGAIVTATAVVFWIRAMLLEMTGSQIPSRVLTRYVESRFDQAVLASLIGVFVYTVVVLLAVPGADDPAPPPRVSVMVAGLLAVGVLLLIVAVIRHSARATRVSRLLQQITHETLAALEHTETPTIGDRRPVDVPPPEVPGRVVRAPTTGWVQSVDVDGLMAALPPHTVMRCEVRLGQLLVTGEPLVTVWDEDGAVDDDSVAAALPLAPSHDAGEDEDVALGIRHLVDVTLASSASSTPDHAAAYEALKHLQAVLRETLVRDRPPSAFVGDDGRVVHLPALWSDDILDDAIHPVREGVSASPTLTLALIRMLGALRRDVHRLDDGRWAGQLERHARLALEALRASGVLDAEVERAFREARAQGFVARQDTAPVA